VGDFGGLRAVYVSKKNILPAALRAAQHAGI